jgi:hypothetical protein
LSASANFADRGYRMVSATGPHGRILGFLGLPRLSPVSAIYTVVVNDEGYPVQMTDPTSRQRGRPTETKQQLSENRFVTESNI